MLPNRYIGNDWKGSISIHLRSVVFFKHFVVLILWAKEWKRDVGSTNALVYLQ